MPLSTVPNGSSGAYGNIRAKRPLHTGKALPAKAQRLETPTATQAPCIGAASGVPAITEVFAVLYTKKELLSKKKASKKFADGIITVFGDGSAILYDQDSKIVTKGRFKRFGSLENGDQVLEIGNWHAEVDKELTSEDFRRWDGGRGRLRDGRPVVPVVIDPYLGRHLRPHQQEGVRFMYEAVMGLTSPDRTGCILADEMGLGKTLQVITLAWTLLRQGPEGRPLAAKVLVVAPATLVDNWGREVKKWLGSERLQLCLYLPCLSLHCYGTVTGQTYLQTLCLQQASAAKQHYETLRKHAGDLKGAFDLLVCDEGHRLKSVGGNKTIDALLSLDCPRRILLTGTPVQNDLKEFYALLSFVVPDVLGTPAVFNRVYGIPITRSQEATATAEEKELGAGRASELQSKVAVFILRRTQALLAKHLPPLTSLTLFCKPSDQQIGLYSAVLRSKAVASLLYGGGGGEDNTLAVITALRKVANHPDLLLDPSGDAGEATAEGANTGRTCSSSCLPSFSKQFTATGSHQAAGKMQVLSLLLSAIAARGERCVVVSTSTATLDLVGQLVCKAQGLTTVRIDGGTSVEGRQTVVDNFNKLGMGQVFLLSTRAGGAGLNLVGACHLVLYDSDWNPAMDQQAMARIWRDGQTKPCFVYRLLTTGTIEEKVYQRQLMKADLASATVTGGSGAAGGSKGGGKFTREELRQLFSLNTATASDTRDLLPQGKVAGLRWKEPEEVMEDGSPLAAVAASGLVTCLNQMEPTAVSEMARDGAAAGGSPAGHHPLEEGDAPPAHGGISVGNDSADGDAGERDESAGVAAGDDLGSKGDDIRSPSRVDAAGDGVVEGARSGTQRDDAGCLDVLEDW
ncbi:hypothetical protein VOLCADRAFT_99672 [Volvox carteri f. nagariensis]|uniref:DNA repair and recombination protein RAD54B n=1 Tax=Volvox carteri f. nagariensis TaxID=3068 RepID=D8UIC0_VOLCA|nr:uncharacterized protein VOLCADRAFT_99672 [Volvox carteri f. nagariensis]EFJ40540.1 hypothetical protein VOLCADRAFT_99672 [Volvox carteri f. nagariensis]|eukprot:XP_002958390.1 hypothetical protein VOLCADRAFT_99672 [Volvox carteri f. nagariensis]